MAGMIETSHFNYKKLYMLFIILPVPLAYFLIHISLSSAGGWLMLASYEIIPLLGLTGFFWKKHEKSFKTAGIITMLLLAVVIVGEILFLPYQAYELWFNLFRSGIERGRVSHLFVKLGSWITALICWLIIQRPSFVQALKNSLYLPLFFVFLLWPTIATVFILLLALLWGRMNRDSLGSLFFILVLALIIGLTGVNTKAKGAKFIDQSSDNLITLMTEIWPSLPILYDVPLYGESLSRSLEDGGRPTLTSNIIMTVKGYPGDQIYLRNRVYARPGETAKGVNLSELPMAGEKIPGSKEIAIKILTDYINMVPYTENTAILDMGEAKYALESKEKTLLPEPALFMDDSYILIEEQDREYPLTEDEESLKYFLIPSIPVSSSLERLSGELKGDSPIQTVRNIRSYLTANYTYSLNTQENLNYTDDFLFNTKEGYCLHFASSFVALARLNGIPCRFVEGYLVNFPSEEDFMESYGGMPGEIITGVSGLSSHIWPEIYLSDRGWVSFEVTAPFVRGDSLTSEDRLTRRQLAEIQGLEYLEKERVFFWEKIPPVYYPLPMVIILLLYLFPRVKNLWSKRRNHSSHLITRYIRVAKRNGISLPQERGWIIWEREISLNIRGAAPVISQAMPYILRSRYTQVELGNEEKEILRKGIIQLKSLCNKARRT